jgi:hypothetical protein
MKHALLFGVGSAGDVFPFIALGKGLAANGWQVSLCANPTFEQQVLRAGLAFEPLGTREHYDRITLNPNLWHPRKGTRTILADFQAMDMVRNQRDLARQFAKGPGNRVLISSSLGFGARIAQEETVVPLVTTHLAPIVLRCPKNPPRVPGGWLPNTLLRFAPKMAYRLVDSIADPLTLLWANLLTVLDLRRKCPNLVRPVSLRRPDHCAGVNIAPETASPGLINPRLHLVI